MNSNRLIEIVAAGGLLTYCAYAIYSGHVAGRTRSYSRREEPWSFWIIVAIALSCGAAILFGATSWRT